MKASDLIHLVGATKKKKVGRRHRFNVTDRRCKLWAARHQDLLRRAFRDPNAEVDLVGGESPDRLTAWGFDAVELPDGRTRWIHPIGDDYGDRAILGLVDALGDAIARRQRGANLLHGLLPGAP